MAPGAWRKVQNCNSATPVSVLDFFHYGSPVPHLSHPQRRPLKRSLLTVVLASLATVAALFPALDQGVDLRPTSGSSSVLCTGFGPCSDAGMSAKGYHAVWDQMFWGMYAGKNCTNYVAYRMIKAGMSATRPAQLKPGKGNAEYWGPSFGSATNSTPTVGSIAWWKANAPGAGSGGHVAYVERVNSATDIVVSESNWDGNFDWRHITTAANWPSGFIHLIDNGAPPPPPVAPPPPLPPASTPPATVLRSVSPPTISGTVQVGRTLAATDGSWSPAAQAVAYQWLADGKAISGETGRTFLVGRSRLGKRISVQVTATTAGQRATATSAPTAPAIPGTIAVTTPPVIEGSPAIGATVTAVPPVTSPAPTASTVQWYADGVPIAGATSWTLHAGPDLAGKRLTVQVTGTRESFANLSTTSAPSDPVQAPPIQFTTPGSVGGAPQVGSPLAANPGVTDPAQAAATYAWLRDGEPIAGATTPAYTPTKADAGHRVSVQVTLTAPGHFPSINEYAAGTIKAATRLTVAARSARRAATLTIKLKTAGLPVKDGRIVVRVGKHTVATLAAKHKVRLRVAGLKPGKRTITVLYRGTATVLGDSATARVKVKR
jgi:surface antigen